MNNVKSPLPRKLQQTFNGYVHIFEVKNMIGFVSQFGEGIFSCGFQNYAYLSSCYEYTNAFLSYLAEKGYYTKAHRVGSGSRPWATCRGRDGLETLTPKTETRRDVAQFETSARRHQGHQL